MRIASVLPQNWRLDESNGQIIISRREPIRSHGCIGLDLSWVRHPELLQEAGRVFGTENVYVADSSLFPAAPGVNPSWTIMAFARHVAMNIAKL